MHVFQKIEYHISNQCAFNNHIKQLIYLIILLFFKVHQRQTVTRSDKSDKS